MRGLSYEKSEKQSTSKRDVYIVRSSDRETDRDEILRNLNQAVFVIPIFQKRSNQKNCHLLAILQSGN